jgi:serine protease DegQ
VSSQPPTDEAGRRVKKVTLYSSSTRTRRTETPADVSGDAAAAANPAGVAPPSVGSPGRFRRFLTRHERALMFGVMALFAAALAATHWSQRAPARALTQQDIDAAVLHTLENNELPSIYAKAYEAVRPSVVRVMGLGPAGSDDADTAKDSAGKTPAKGSAKPPSSALKDRGANDGFPPGKGKGPVEAGKDRNASKDKGGAEPGDKQADKKEGKSDGRGVGVGTGVVIVDKGIILTNLHVVIGAERIKVRFFDGMESEATVIATRPEHDLAVLQAKTIPDDLQSAALRSTADLAVGDHVIAIGYPFGIGPSASAGVVSGLRREYHSPEGKRVLTNLIQFDAAANPGNSGGPLVTASGEVVGIVTGILNPTEQRVFIGIGFAVPIENAASAAGISPF